MLGEFDKWLFLMTAITGLFHGDTHTYNSVRNRTSRPALPIRTARRNRNARKIRSFILGAPVVVASG